ncbi:peptidase C39-like protein [Stackebrandtia endophytica]|uniref:Peptidase C39-like protein n=1 Tax=Stackebrandtia endophytica TaxID=1496996 RepID=A0A543B2N7_9ACTN|nr:peptidase C39 family protein [Stackebrandtia endophytica]TQL79066.1 peptidase C39-like protein [Stackebrandtia endophytica]
MSGSLTRRSVFAAGLAATSTVFIAGSAAAEQDGSSMQGRPRRDEGIDFFAWVSRGDWQSGGGDGVEVIGAGRARRPGIRIGEPIDTIDFTDPHTGNTAAYDIATWTSPERRSAVEASELIASWNADTPDDTWIQVEVQGRYLEGETTPWFIMGRWAAGDGDIARASVNRQGDPRSTVYTDTLAVDDADVTRLGSYRLRITLHRLAGTEVTPTVWRVGAMTSHVPDRYEVPESVPGVATGIELPVPRYSQSVHAGQYPEYGGGGQAWCSPTSSQMVLEYFGRTVSEEDLAWVDPEYDDPQICHAARFTFDTAYDGCGNWPFNAAYAAAFDDMDAIITRLGSLADAEALIAAGFPVITSQSFLEEELDGAGYGTAGHLMVLIGFTEEGDVIANDPASPSNEAVRRIYNRRQFENIWLRTKRKDANGNDAGGSGGVCYIFKERDQSWPRHLRLTD